MDFFFVINLIIGFVTFSQISASVCPSPHVSSDVFTTSDAQLASETVFIIQFNLECSGQFKDTNLHAEFHGKSFPVTRIEGQYKYQISIGEEHKKIPKGSYTVRLFDDESYSELRKAQRTGGDLSSVKSLSDFNFYHRGTSRGPWIQTEHIATAGAAIVCYLAYSFKSHLQS